LSSPLSEPLFFRFYGKSFCFRFLFDNLCIVSFSRPNFVIILFFKSFVLKVFKISPALSCFPLSKFGISVCTFFVVRVIFLELPPLRLFFYLVDKFLVSFFSLFAVAIDFSTGCRSFFFLAPFFAQIHNPLLVSAPLLAHSQFVRSFQTSFCFVSTPLRFSSLCPSPAFLDFCSPLRLLLQRCTRWA